MSISKSTSPGYQSLLSPVALFLSCAGVGQVIFASGATVSIIKPGLSTPLLTLSFSSRIFEFFVSGMVFSDLFLTLSVATAEIT